MPLLLSTRAVTAPPIDLFTSEEARALSLPLRSEAFTRIRPGVYARRSAWKELTSWGRYAARVHAFVRTHPDAVLALESAAVLHGLPHFGEARHVHVSVDAPTKSARYGDIRVHTSAQEREVVRIGSALVTSFRDTVVDLARTLPPAQALAVVDAALSPVQGGRHALEDLRDLCEARDDRRGVSRARWVWAHADARSESPTESISRAVIAWSGFEAPDLQQEFSYEGVDDRVDFLFRSGAVVGEADGWGKYELAEPTSAAKQLTAEKRREDRLRRHGHPVVRWESIDVWRVTPLCEKLRAAGVPQLSAPSPAYLETLKHRTRRAF